MPRPSDFRENSSSLSLFNRIEAEIQSRCGEPVPIALHVGDTHFTLPDELIEPLSDESWRPNVARYGDTRGLPFLRQRLIDKLQKINHLPISSEQEVQLTLGATGALLSALRRLLSPGDEVLVPAPYWPILRSVASIAGVHLAEVPFWNRVVTGDDPVALLETGLTPRTRAIYLNNPNNPTGVLLTPRQVESVARWAEERDLWIISDEAYEDFVWKEGVRAVSPGSLTGFWERTVSIYSFSKSYAAAGIRLGYAAGPEGVITQINPAVVGTAYEPPQPAQVMAVRGLERREQLLPKLRGKYREGLDAALTHLSVPVLSSAATFFLWLDLRDRWSGLGEREILERMLSAGVVLSSGKAFGGAYDGWARFCFTAEPPEVVAEAAKRVSNL